MEREYFQDKPTEKCGVFAVSLFPGSNQSAAVYAVRGLSRLQHRGAEATGISSYNADEEYLETHKGLGLVRDVYTDKVMGRLVGNIAIGHNKYSTSGKKNRHLQPVNDYPIGFSLAHNGNLPNTKSLDSELERHHLKIRHYNDSEKLALYVANKIRQGMSMAEGIESAYPFIVGSASCVAIHNNEVAGFRDAYGIRPLELGKSDKGYFISSETSGLDIVNAEHTDSVKPGELVIIKDGEITLKQIVEPNPKLDIFEFVYFARHDSMLYGKRVNQVRKAFGQKLAEAHPPKYLDLDNIIVVPVPDTSIPASEGYADALGLRHTQAILKDRYVGGRSFMQPTQEERESYLNLKHTIMSEDIIGKDVVLIDDSIVRLNTMPKLVKRMYELGAKSVNVLIASAPVRYPDFYGIDTPNQKELAAANMTIEEMKNKIGSRYLGFLSIDEMVEATGIPKDKFNLSPFNGIYPIDIGDNKDMLYEPADSQYMDRDN